MIIAATGHRPDKLGGFTLEVRERARRVAREHLALSCASRVIVGMALGFDSAVAHACCDLGIPFVAAVPFKGHDAKWDSHWRDYYRRLLEKAELVRVISKGDYTPELFQRRNEWMVDHCDRVMALWDGSEGGTRNCIRYAQKRKRPIENLWADFAP